MKQRKCRWPCVCASHMNFMRLTLRHARERHRQSKSRNTKTAYSTRIRYSHCNAVCSTLDSTAVKAIWQFAILFFSCGFNSFWIRSFDADCGDIISNKISFCRHFLSHNLPFVWQGMAIAISDERHSQQANGMWAVAGVRYHILRGEGE